MVTVPLVGARTTRQIDEAVASLDVELSDGDVGALRARIPGMALR